VIFGEDASRIRKGNAPAIMTAIRHLCLNLS
jgi:predicted transposase YbfD/YdcC